MRKYPSLKAVMASGGMVFLCAAPQLSHGEASPALVAQTASVAPAPVPRDKAAAPIDLLEGLTLTGEQEAKVDQIREDTNARMATVSKDKAIDAQTADAMRRGYVRIENGKIFEVLTPEQQKQVRHRIASLKDPKAKSQYPMRRLPAPAQASAPQ
jgi:Spy/CpxP family protein refolding chaperone